jgi:hypothetical protein
MRPRISFRYLSSHPSEASLTCVHLVLNQEGLQILDQLRGIPMLHTKRTMLQPSASPTHAAGDATAHASRPEYSTIPRPDGFPLPPPPWELKPEPVLSREKCDGYRLVAILSAYRLGCDVLVCDTFC